LHGMQSMAARTTMNPKMRRRIFGWIAICAATVACVALLSRGMAGRARTFELKVPGNAVWSDTRIDLNPGEKILITASGTIQYASEESGPEGLARTWKDLLRIPPVKDAGRGALIGRVGDFDAALPFLVGARTEFVATIAGRLYLGVNQQAGESADGSFDVRVEVLDAGTAEKAVLHGARKSGTDATFAMPPERRVAAVTAQILDQIPRRVRDQDGRAGDMVNFIILGSQERLKSAFEGGGWVLVDRTKADAVLHSLLSTLSKEEYVEMPMSELYLYGRPQDFGFAHADPYAVVATRHHLRVWKAPMSVGGQSLWVGAATHDVGFETDQRNGGVTHRIEPEVDEEREYVARTLLESGIVTQWAHVLPHDAVSDATTATGGHFHSDGRILVLAVGEGSAGDAAMK
jgi:hypothetical protein